MERRPLTEIGVSALIIAICAVFWVQAYKLPPGSFEPLGSGPVPMYTASIIVVCCLIVMARAANVLARGPGLRAAFDAEFAGGSPAAAISMAAATIAYVALLNLRVGSFGLITFVFLTVLIWGLERFRLRVLPSAAVTAAIAAFGAEYLVTHVFVVDLPT